MQYKIVCFGGGNAMPKVVLEPLKKCSFLKIVSITSMLDSGGSTREICEEFSALPPGDIKKHLLALSFAPSWKKKLFSLRFGKWKFPGGHVGHSFANIFIAGLEKITGNYKKTLKILHDFMEVKGEVLPAIIKKADLWAELENGKLIKGEDEIDVPKKHDGSLKIKKIFIKPKVSAYPPVLQAIKKADLIIIGPGDLYSSILCCFLAKGIKSAFLKTKAKKLFLCPAMTKFGETQGFSVKGFADEVEKYIGTSLDWVLYNNFFPEKSRVEAYRKKHPELLELVKVDQKLPKEKFVGKNLLLKKGPVEYDPLKVKKVILSFLKKL